MNTVPWGNALGLFKFGNREHVEAFSRGVLYMNTAGYFARIENNPTRSDRDDTLLWSHHAKLLIEVGDELLPIKNIIGPIRHSNEEDRRVNVFCMFALRESHSEELVDPRNLEFGNSYALITQGDEFLHRVLAAAESKGLTLTWRLISYVARDSYNGPMGVFRKFDTFAYQSELRIVVLPGFGEPHILEVGDLRDIVIVGATDQLNKRLVVKRADDGSAVLGHFGPQVIRPMGR